MSDKGMRLFIAMDIPPEAKEIIRSAVDAQPGAIAGARWVKPEILHMTLKFIGEFAEDGLDHLSKEIRATGELCGPFKASLCGCGAFPSRGRARVIWVGMSAGMEEAAMVARKLDARLERVGVKREDRPFRGHITLARLNHPGDCTGALRDLEVSLEGLRDIDFDVDEMVLYRSILGSRGPMYIVLERIALGGKPRGKD